MLPILLALLVPGPAHAADVCAMTSVEQDRFGGGTTLTTEPQYMSGFTIVGVQLATNPAGSLLTLTVKAGGATSGKVALGTTIPLALADGTVLNLQTVQEGVMTPFVSGDSVVTLIPYILGVDRASLEVLGHSPVTAVRFPLPTGPYEWEVKKGIQKRLQNGALCAVQKTSGPASP